MPPMRENMDVILASLVFCRVDKAKRAHLLIQL